MVFKVFDDKAGLSNALFQVTHGLYILTANMDGKLNGQCLDAMMQVTNMPPRIAIGVGKRNLTHEMIAKTGKFLVCVIDRDDPACYDKVKRFGFQSGRNVDKFSGIAYELSAKGLPLLPDSKAFYECEVIPQMTMDIGTHTLFVATVFLAGIRDQGEPLTYNQYRKDIKKGG